MAMEKVNYIVLISALLCILLDIASGAINVTDEINRLEEKISTMKPTPELIASVIHQLQMQCNKSKNIDEATMNKVGKCLESNINETVLIADIKDAIPKGKLDNVFRDTCLKWPKIKLCLRDVFNIINECWDKGDKVTKVVDEGIKFFCGDDNDGAKIAMFLAEGGMECLEKHGDEVKTCVETKHEIPEAVPEFALEHLQIPASDEICKTINELQKCTVTGLKKCKDPTPENLVTSMIRAVGSAVNCTMADLRSKKLSSTSGQYSMSALMVAYVPAMFMFIMFA